jgi:hypothetical protein
VCEGEGKNNADSGWFDDNTECLIEFDPWLLRETANDPSSLMES